MNQDKYQQQTMHLIEKKVEEILIANLVLKFHINDLQNLKRNKKAYVLMIKIMKKIIKLKEGKIVKRI